ncbi:MAG: putative quinol monooxygenase [Streptosporangiaceae bacterium]
MHAEDGCELYALHQADGKLVMIERWSSPGALDVHSKGPNLARLAAALDGKLTGPLDVTVLEPVPAGDAAKGQVS